MKDESDQNTVTTEPVTEEVRLNTLKDEANSLGITFHPNIKEEKLAKKIQNFNTDNAVPVVRKIPCQTATLLTPQQKRAKIVKDATKLIRARITCMNPNKTDWEGEIFTVSNSIVPTQKKFVPFEAENGWHIPQIMLNAIKERKCQMFKNIKHKNGSTTRTSFLINEFNVEILPQLTEQEMNDLAMQQAMANGGNI